MMNKEEQEEENRELRELGWALSSFFGKRESPEDAKILGGVVDRLARRTGSGGSHLEPGEVGDLGEAPLSFRCIGGEEDDLPLVLTSDGRLYFRRYFEYESEVAGALAGRLAKMPLDPSASSLDFFTQSLAPQVDEYQGLAVGAALRRDLLLLTGGPGTGKTRTIVVVLAALLQADPSIRIALAAPTGKAAFRMRESVLATMEDLDLPDDLRASLVDCSHSSTLHRLLGPQAGSIDFRRSSRNPLPHDVVVVDEASMVDLPLMAKLCSALRDEAKLILVGDPDQLAPVQGGAVFSGLARSSVPNRFPSAELPALAGYSSVAGDAAETDRLAGSLVSLALSHRREGSPAATALGALCDAVRDGDGEEVLAIARGGGDGFIRFYESLDDESVRSVAQDGFSGLAEATGPAEALSALADFRILCAHNQGRHGVDDWNHFARSLLPGGDTRPLPIVVGVNDYSVRLFNGDDGVILGKRAHFPGEDGMREVALSRLPGHSPAFALSIHRSQGSEYGEVLIVLPPEGSRLLSRELLYVAVSRAKRGITFAGSPDSLLQSIAQRPASFSGVANLMGREASEG